MGIFSDVYRDNIIGRPFVGALLSGLLALEFVLRKRLRNTDPEFNGMGYALTCKQLIANGYKISAIDDEQYEVLNSLNALRDKLACQITYEPDLDQLRQLWRRAALAFTERSDGISQGLEALEASTDPNLLDDWVWTDLFIEICDELAHEIGIFE